MKYRSRAESVVMPCDALALRFRIYQAADAEPWLAALYEDVVGHLDEPNSTLIVDAEHAIAGASWVMLGAFPRAAVDAALRRSRARQIPWCDLLTYGDSAYESAREATRALARRERQLGTPPERVLMFCKVIASRAQWPMLHRDLARALCTEVARWAIEGYFGL